MSQLKTVLLLGLMSAVLILIGRSLGDTYFYGAIALAVGMNFFSYFYSDKLVLRMHNAQEVTAAEAPQLHRIVEELARSANVPMPKVYIIPDPQPNAFATGRNPSHAAVAVNQGILEILTERELRGVLGHELSHVNNRDILIATIATMMAAAITYTARFAPFLGGGQSRDSEERESSGAGAFGFVLLLLAPIAATLVQLGISRSREYLADESGAKLTGDPEALAMALMKLQRGVERIAPAVASPATAALHIVNPFAAFGGLQRLFSTHPPLEDRIARLEAMAHQTPQPFAARSRLL